MFKNSKETSKNTHRSLNINPNLETLLDSWRKQSWLSKKKKMFHVGVGCIDLFPHQLWGKLLTQAWRQSYYQLGQFYDPRGYLPLRQAICEYVRSTRGLNCNEEQIIIVNGTQQAIHLTAYALLQANDEVCLDEPGYDAALRFFEVLVHR